MKTLQRLWEDLKRGENLDLYITVLVAFIVAFLNIFDIAPQNLLVSITLAVLALLASALLGLRHRMDDLNQKISTTGEMDIQVEFPANIQNDLENASEIWLIGSHLTGPIRHYFTLFENKLRQGKTIKVLVHDPESSACLMSAYRSPGKTYIEREKASILATLGTLGELKKIAPKRLEIRIIDYLLPYGGYMINPEKSDGAIYLTKYTFQTGTLPKIVYRHKSRWYDFTKSEIMSMWNHGKEWRYD